MVEGARSGAKSQASANNKSFNDQNQTKIVLRRLPPTLTSEQFLEIVSPLPDHDYYRFCKADLSLGQQFAFCRAYLNIPNRQDLVVFTEKFQGYVFVDKNGTEYSCSLEYAPNQSRPKVETQSKKDPKVNSFEQDPEYQTFVANMNAPLSAAEALPNAEAILEEIEKKQREVQESKHKPGLTTTPLLEFLKRRRDEKKQEKQMRIQQNAQRRNNKQAARNNAANANEEEYNASGRYGGGGERANRQQRGYEKSEYRNSGHEPKRSNAGEYAGGKPGKNRDSQSGKSKQQQQSSAPKEPKIILSAKPKVEESTPTDTPAKREAEATNAGNNENARNEERPRSSNKPSSGAGPKNPGGPPKNRPSIQIYNPSERARQRKQQNPPS